MITTVDDFAKGIWERNKNNSVGNLEEMLINGNKFYQFVVKNEFNLFAGGELLPGETRYLVTSNAGTNYLISYLTGDARLEELFSTFKFIQPTTATDLSVFNRVKYSALCVGQCYQEVLLTKEGPIGDIEGNYGVVAVGERYGDTVVLEELMLIGNINSQPKQLSGVILREHPDLDPYSTVASERITISQGVVTVVLSVYDLGQKTGQDIQYRITDNKLEPIISSWHYSPLVYTSSCKCFSRGGFTQGEKVALHQLPDSITLDG